MRPGRVIPATPVTTRLRRLVEAPWWAVPLVAVSGLALVARPDPGVRVVAGTAIAIGVAQQVARVANRWRRPVPDRVTVSVVTTVALGVALGVWLSLADHHHLGVAVGVGVVLVVAAIVVHQMVRTAQGLLRTAHLPGAPSAPPPRLGTRWLVAELCAASAILLVAGAVDAPPVVDAVVAGGLGIATLVALRPYPAALRYRHRVLLALQRWRPVFVLPYNGTAGFHLGMWTPYLAPHRFVVITTRVTSYDRAAADYDVPVLLAPGETRAAVAAMIPGTVRAAFYVHNGHTRPFLRHRGVPHVLLQHGDSDKLTSVNPVALRYDTVVVAGQAAIDRFAQQGLDVRPERLLVLGRPQTADIRTVRRPIREVSHPTVLYAPTWKGTTEETNYSSLLLGPRVVAELLRRGLTVIFRPHPAGRHFAPHVTAIAEIQGLLRVDRERTGRPHRFGAEAEQVSVAEVANAADAMISDVSGIVTDFRQSLKPVAMISTKLPAAEFTAGFPSTAGAYVIEPDLANLEAVLDQLLVSDPAAAARVEQRTYFLGGYDEDGSAVAFRRYLDGLLAADPTASPPSARP